MFVYVMWEEMLRRISKQVKSKKNLWKIQVNRISYNEIYYFFKKIYEYRKPVIEVVLKDSNELVSSLNLSLRNEYRVM